MVDLRARNAAPIPEDIQAAQDLLRLTPPARDLLDALKDHFAIYLPKDGPPGQVCAEVAEQRGAWLVIHFLENIHLAHLNQERQ